MYKVDFLSNNESLIASYKHYAAKLNKIKYIAKKMCFGEKFDKNKNNPCKIWQTIKSLLSNNKKALPFINKIAVDDNEICDTTAIVDHFINYFANVSNNLAQTYAD